MRITGYRRSCHETFYDRTNRSFSGNLQYPQGKDPLFPDGRFFTEGDNQHSDYWYYNNFNRQAAKLAGDLFADPYFKGEYRRMVGSEIQSDTPVFQNNVNFKNYMSFNAIQWLIMNDPEVDFTTDRSSLAKSKYFGSPIGKIYAKTDWGYIKSTPGTYGTAAAEMKIGEQYSANHDHLDAGTFQLYFRGLMTGDYGAQNEENSYGDSFDKNYYKRTVAHNALTIEKSGESWSTSLDYMTGTATASSNDGGQLAANETNSFSTWKNTTPYKRASVINHSIAANNSYSYIKGDITNAYASNKADEVVRSMAFLPTGKAGAPAVMVVFDKVTSDSSSYTKKFLLHTASEPTVTNNNKVQYDNTNTLTYSSSSVTYDGRLTMNTLLPASATITKVPGTKVGSTTYNGPSDSKFEPEWGRVEVKAASEGTTTRFLNVLTLSDTYRYPDDATIIGSESSKLVGAKIKNTGSNAEYNMVTMFANTGAASLNESATFTIDGDETEGINLFVFGLAEGDWAVKQNGEILDVLTVTGEGGTLSVSDIAAGTYTVAPFDQSELQSTVVCDFDVSDNSGMGYDDQSDIWADLSGKGNDMDISLDSNTYWTANGLYVKGSSNVTTLPAAAASALNGDKFTFEFVVSNVNAANSGLCASIFGNVKDKFALYKVIGSNNVYLKMPGWRSILRRPHQTVSAINGHHNIITVDRLGGGMQWYIDGVLVSDLAYSTDTEIPAITLITEANNSAVYKKIKVYGYCVNASQAAAIYSDYASN